MRIIEIKQIKNGRQERPYADHIYQWNMKLNFVRDEEEVLLFCQTYLEDAARNEADYFTAYRDNSLSFNEHMAIVCGGYYTLRRNEDRTWTYTVTREYID